MQINEALTLERHEAEPPKKSSAARTGRYCGRFTARGICVDLRRAGLYRMS